MRQAFVETLSALADEYPEIVLLTGDLGFSVLESFNTRFPGRLINVGVAEQNMMGMAAGLAASGKVVFTYSIANFAILRCLEQFRNDVCYHDLPVIAVSVGAGVAYGAQGYTHHGIEDAAISRLLPHIAVASPGDPPEVRWATRQLALRRRPASLRLGRGGEAAVHGTDPQGPIDKALTLHPPGQDITIIANGAILPEATEAIVLLRTRGIDAGLISMPFLQPLDEAAVEKIAHTSRLVLTVEEHVHRGGLGGAVAEVMAGLDAPRARLARAGLEGVPLTRAASQRSVRRHYGLDGSGIAARVLAELETG